MRKGILVLAVALLAAPAGADDGAASLAAGGIVFTSGTPVRMQAEDLYISPKKVRVRFEFFNPTKQDVTTVVAFPLPDLEWSPPTGYGPMTKDPVNFVGFTVTVDGKRAHFQTEQRAIFKDRDVTKLVKGAGLPVNAIAAGARGLTREEMTKAGWLDPVKKARLVQLGILEEDTEYPYWITRTRFYWTQKFPAGKTVVIAHEYQPISGSWNESHWVFEEPKAVKAFCADPAMVARAKSLSGPGFLTKYVLKTAKTWSGPIGRFHLTLDKLKPDNVLSLCWDGALKRTGPTTFEFTARDYVPVRDIDMAVLE